MVNNENGLSLLEVMISLFLISFVVLNITLLELSSLRTSKNILNFSLAELQIQNLLARLQVNKEHRDEQIKLWNEENHKLLPQGRGEVTGSISKNNHIIIYWGGKKSCSQTQLSEAGCIRFEIT